MSNWTVTRRSSFGDKEKAITETGGLLLGRRRSKEEFLREQGGGNQRIGGLLLGRRRSRRRNGVMVRGYVHEHVYKHPWERVTEANWRKYSDPEHRSQLSHVLEVDTIGRELDSESGQLSCTRVITVNAPGPWWLQRMLGTTVCHCLENSTVDGKNRSMEMTTRNVTMKDFLEVEERCSYTPHPENSGWTVFKQETNISCASLSGLASMAERIEQRCVENFQKNSGRGRDVMERVCSFLEHESAL